MSIIMNILMQYDGYMDLSFLPPSSLHSPGDGEHDHGQRVCAKDDVDDPIELRMELLHRPCIEIMNRQV
jgi:hypothetical protein